jgi:hypothetical protein
MQTSCELSSRTELRAFRAGQDLLIVAQGELPTPGYRVDIQQDPRRIFPPQFNLLRCPLPGIWPDVITPFRYCEAVRYPDDQAAVTVHHAEGAEQVTIEEHGRPCRPTARPCRAVPTGPARRAPTRRSASRATSASMRRSPPPWLSSHPWTGTPTPWPGSRWLRSAACSAASLASATCSCASAAPTTDGQPQPECGRLTRQHHLFASAPRLAETPEARRPTSRTPRTQRPFHMVLQAVADLDVTSVVAVLTDRVTTSPRPV